jgi:hypothetical protein
MAYQSQRIFCRKFQESGDQRLRSDGHVLDGRRARPNGKVLTPGVRSSGASIEKSSGHGPLSNRQAQVAYQC